MMTADFGVLICCLSAIVVVFATALIGAGLNHHSYTLFAGAFGFGIAIYLGFHGAVLILFGQWNLPDLASANYRSEHVSIEPIVVPELKFGDDALDLVEECHLTREQVTRMNILRGQLTLLKE